MKQTVAITNTTTKGHFEITCKNGRGFNNYAAKNLNEVILSLANVIKTDPDFLGEITKIEWVEAKY